MQDDRGEELQISKLEIALIVGVIGCMLFATWEVGHLLADDWLRGWTQGDPWLRRRVILYGIAFAMSVTSLLTTTALATRPGRFGRTVSRAFLWYGTLLLLSTIATFVFDCLPEVAAGFGGAGMFIAAIYVLQRRFFTGERIARLRVAKGQCFSCGAQLPPGARFCPACGVQVGHDCSRCSALVRFTDRFCPGCGLPAQRTTLKLEPGLSSSE